MTPWMVTHFLWEILTGDEENNGEIVPKALPDMQKDGSSRLDVEIDGERFRMTVVKLEKSVRYSTVKPAEAVQG